MPLSEDDVHRAVDEALEAAWPNERRRAIRRWAYETAARVVAALVALWALSVVVHLIVGVTVPWTFFVCIGPLMTVLAFSQSEGREHLRRH